MSPRRNWDSPNPSLPSECGPPPEPKGRGANSPAGEGMGENQFRRLEKKLNTLPTLWPTFSVVSIEAGWETSLNDRIIQSSLKDVTHLAKTTLWLMLWVLILCALHSV
jgi:hypothetical protein